MNEYLELLKIKLTNIFGEDFDISYKSILKNNGVKLHGISILDKSSNISPVIYVNDYYENGYSVEECVAEVIKIYEANKHESVEAKKFLYFDNVKDIVIPKLINAGKNQELLQNVPHIEWEDLAIIFQVYLSNCKEGNATITINNNHLKIWDISVSELYMYARTNINRLKPHKIRSITDILKETVVDVEIPEDFDSPMHVLSSEDQFNGSYYMTCNYILKEFAERVNTNIIILPSSTHEVILLPDEGYPFEYLQSIVMDVNQNEVKAEDYLSDNIYYYDKETNSITRTEHIL